MIGFIPESSSISGILIEHYIMNRWLYGIMNIIRVILPSQKTDSILLCFCIFLIWVKSMIICFRHCFYLAGICLRLLLECWDIPILGVCLGHQVFLFSVLSIVLVIINLFSNHCFTFYVSMIIICVLSPILGSLEIFR